MWNKLWTLFELDFYKCLNLWKLQELWNNVGAGRGTRPEMVLPRSTVWPAVWLLLPLEMKERGKGGQGEEHIWDGVGLCLACMHIKSENSNWSLGSWDRDTKKVTFINALIAHSRQTHTQTKAAWTNSLVLPLCVFSFCFPVLKTHQNTPQTMGIIRILLPPISILILLINTDIYRHTYWCFSP